MKNMKNDDEMLSMQEYLNETALTPEQRKLLGLPLWRWVQRRYFNANGCNPPKVQQKSGKNVSVAPRYFWEICCDDVVATLRKNGANAFAKPEPPIFVSTCDAGSGQRCAFPTNSFADNCVQSTPFTKCVFG